MLMKSHYSSDGVKDQKDRSTAHYDAFTRFVECKLISHDGFPTDRGDALVAAILGTPVPVVAWVLPEEAEE